MISIKDMNKAAVLAALYNAACPQGMGFLNYDPKPMTIEEAEQLRSLRFDYLRGRVMKISLQKDEVDTSGYDRDNGLGNGELVIKSIKAGFPPDNEITREIHAGGKEAAAKLARLCMEEPTTIQGGIINLGLSNVKDKLAPAVDKALKGA